jgi:hypothetical protein
MHTLTLFRASKAVKAQSPITSCTDDPPHCDTAAPKEQDKETLVHSFVLKTQPGGHNAGRVYEFQVRYHHMS